MRWIFSEGGPLLLLPEAELRYWNGCEAPRHGAINPTGTKTDYERACDVSDYTGIIQAGRAEALVLGEHMQTTWIPANEVETGLIVQWMYAEDEDSVSAYLKGIPESIFKATGLILNISFSVLYLFDSALAGTSLKTEDTLIIEVSPGTTRLRPAA